MDSSSNDLYQLPCVLGSNCPRPTCPFSHPHLNQQAGIYQSNNDQTLSPYSVERPDEDEILIDELMEDSLNIVRKQSIVQEKPTKERKPVVLIQKQSSDKKIEVPADLSDHDILKDLELVRGSSSETSTTRSLRGMRTERKPAKSDFVSEPVKFKTSIGQNRKAHKGSIPPILMKQSRPENSERSSGGRSKVDKLFESIKQKRPKISDSTKKAIPRLSKSFNDTSKSKLSSGSSSRLNIELHRSDSKPTTTLRKSNIQSSHARNDT